MPAQKLPPISEAIELWDKDTRVVIAKFGDDTVAVCTSVDDLKRCYVTSRPSPEIYYIAQAFYSGIGLKGPRKIYG